MSDEKYDPVRKMVFNEKSDPLWQKAVERAQQSFRFFWRELSWEYRRIVPDLDLAAIKLAFVVSDQARAKHDVPEAEHMWVGNVQFDGRILRGRLLNDASYIPHLRGGKEVSAPLAQLEDWIYTSSGVLCGGFTVQAMRAGMSTQERKEHDEAWGLPFPEAELCNITPYETAAAKYPKGLGHLWGLPFETALQQASEKEHPMSENMRERFVNDLQKQPGLAQAVMDDGWTLLQRDALAGNLAPVQALLALGADAYETRTPLGDSALDLAQRMGWPRIVAVLG